MQHQQNKYGREHITSGATKKLSLAGSLALMKEYYWKFRWEKASKRWPFKVQNRSQDAHFPTRTVEQVLIALSLQQATVGSFYSDLKIAGICGVQKKI